MMIEQYDVKEIERKIYTTISQDGFNQMLIGLVLLGFIINTIIPNDSFITGLVFSLIYGGYCVIISIIIKGLRKRFTYTRIGYVKTKQGKLDLMLIFVLFAVLFFAIFSIFCIEMNLRDHPVRMIGFIFPLSAGALLYAHLYHDRLWFRLAAFYLIYGVALFLIPFLNYETKMFLMYAGFGIITLFTGIVRLHRFLKTHPGTIRESAHVT
ncbi:MAG: hypothetical protein JSW02_09440 [candidate division WOR-3 bacterium]|nr:MAG: hypothetical protein JSW02_09440 [candidate division WOR-3 bacterium]